MKRIVFLIYLGMLVPLALFCIVWRVSIMSNEINTEIITQLTTNLITAASVIGAALISLIGVVIADIIHLRSINRHLGFGKDEASMKRQLEDKLGSSGKSVAEQLGIGTKSISEQLGVGNDDKSITAQLGITSKSVTEQIGTSSKSITEQLGTGSKSITEQLGVGTDDKSLTAQHREMYDTITNIYDVLHDNQVRQSAENTSQANLAATMAAFQQSYVAALNEISELKAENLSLKSENTALREQITSLQSHLEESGEDSDDEDMGLDIKAGAARCRTF